MKNIQIVWLVILFVLFAACNNSNSNSAHNGPIILGDSSTIVTETDPQYLTNNIDDAIPRVVEQQKEEAVPEPKDTVVATVQEKPKAEAAKPQEKGLALPFETFGVLITNVEANLPKNTNWAKANAVSMTLKNGSLQGETIKTSMGTITKLQQRTQTVVMLQHTNGKDYKLAAMPSYTSEWRTVAVKNSSYTISGLDKKDIHYNNKFNAKTLSRAAQKLARNLRLSRRDEQKLLNSIKKVSRPNQAPCSIALQSVIWKISGKDANGKSVEKEVRVDIPL